MKKSRYFSDLIKSYNDEVDDLLTDSEGKSVLQKRLNDKRREIDAILPMIEFSPEMVAVSFYGAFGFQAPEVMQGIVLSEPGRTGFIAWSRLKKTLTVSDWAEPLIASALKVAGGDAFLVTTAALEFLRTRDSSASNAPAIEHETKQDHDEDDDNDDEARDLGEAGADWLAEQGFESLDH